MAKKKPAKRKVVRVKAFGAFDKYRKVPYRVERDRELFDQWVKQEASR